MFKSVTQNYTALDVFLQHSNLDVVHLSYLAILEDDTQAAQSQPAIIHRAFYLLIDILNSSVSSMRTKICLICSSLFNT